MVDLYYIWLKHTFIHICHQFLQYFILHQLYRRFDLLRFHRRFARVDIYRRVDLLKKEERRPRFELPTLGAVGGDEDR